MCLGALPRVACPPLLAIDRRCVTYPEPTINAHSSACQKSLDIEDFLAGLRFEQSGKLEILPIDLL
jgi:hypothetical protein